MGFAGICCARLKDEKTLMKTGLGLVLVGHVNFLLGGLEHGAVLRHINMNKEDRDSEYAISNFIALVSGLMAIIAGISAIVLSRNMQNKSLNWFLLVVCILAALLAAASAVGLVYSMVMALAFKGINVQDNCKSPDTIGYFNITNECPYDPTRIYGTTIVLWIPLILLSMVEVAFAGQCCATSVFFLDLPCPGRHKKVTRRVRMKYPKDRDWSSHELQQENELLPCNTPNQTV
ncbi:transmembrane protein 54a [Denticeps clupeoides]|uniref:Keratinocyte-associated protein 3 n=1 Tax=Denticeps clupeoides TaxID=299321 RepID=A0AAY4AHJ5_9TELE|nr:keratinocyte-associated protein 3-like [Denticeps clupeoides]